ncbi:MAG: HEAT repeat domain-containing protein, partial [Pirellulaceae bacterium]
TPPALEPISHLLSRRSHEGVKEAIHWLETGFEPRHEFVAFPSFSPDSLCESGVLYFWDNPLILDDLRSGVDFRVARALDDLESLVACEQHLLSLRNSLVTVPELIRMADALLKIDKTALVAWPSLIHCFVLCMSQRRPGERVSWQALIFDAMRHVLHSGESTEREQILSIWIVSEDANPQALIEILGCRHWDVRKAAAERLGEFGRAASEAIVPLEKLLSDRSKYVRVTASNAISRIRPG